MNHFRTKETHDLYEEHKRMGHLDKECPLCFESTLREFTYWKILDNKFPYDRVTETHHMIVPFRHVTERELTEAEKEELIDIKETYLNEHYFYVLEALPGKKSIPGHFHLHVITPKD